MSAAVYLSQRITSMVDPIAPLIRWSSVERGTAISVARGSRVDGVSIRRHGELTGFIFNQYNFCIFGNLRNFLSIQ